MCLEKKRHLVKWAMVCLDKKFGGLGVKDLGDLNKALLAKWSWRLLLKEGPNEMMLLGLNLGSKRRVVFL